MATIQSLEDIESWKKAREICAILGKYIDEGRSRYAGKWIITEFHKLSSNIANPGYKKKVQSGKR